MEIHEKDNVLYKLNGEHVQRSKLRIETRLKLLACWNPSKYGNKTILQGDKDNPLQAEVKFDVFGEVLKNLQLNRQLKEK